MKKEIWFLDIAQPEPGHSDGVIYFEIGFSLTENNLSKLMESYKINGVLPYVFSFLGSGGQAEIILSKLIPILYSDDTGLGIVFIFVEHKFADKSKKFAEGFIRTHDMLGTISVHDKTHKDGGGSPCILSVRYIMDPVNGTPNITYHFQEGCHISARATIVEGLGNKELDHKIKFSN